MRLDDLAWHAHVLLYGEVKPNHDRLCQLRQEHRDAAHDGYEGDIETCEQCGFVSAAIYQVSSGGRSLYDDFVKTQKTKQETTT